MQQKKIDLLQRNYDKYFSINQKTEVNKADGELDVEPEEEEEERNIVKDDELMSLKNSISLPSGFIPKDFDYYEIDDDLVVIGICGGNEVVFAWLSKSKNTVTMGQPHTFKFGSYDYKEELYLIRGSLLFYDKQQIRMQEVFLTAGKSGYIHVFKLNPELKSIFEHSSFQPHYNRINDICFAPTHHVDFRNLIVSCSDDGTAVISNIECMKPIAVLLLNKMPIDNILSVDWRDGSEEIVTAHLDAIRIWQLTPETIKKITTLTKEIKKDEESNSFDRVHIYDVKVKINTFHNFYIDQIKALHNGVFITKSVDGVVYVWTYECSGVKNEPMIIKLVQFKTMPSMDLNWDQKYGFIKFSVNQYDNLLLMPAETTLNRVSIFHLRNRGDVIFKKLHLEIKNDLKIIKTVLLEDNLSYALALTSNGRLYYHKLKDMNID